MHILKNESFVQAIKNGLSANEAYQIGLRSSHDELTSDILELLIKLKFTFNEIGDVFDLHASSVSGLAQKYRLGPFQSKERSYNYR